MSVLIAIAGLLGINVPRLIGYAIVAVAVVAGAFTIKFHYINVGRDQVTNEIAAGNRETLSNVNAAKGKIDDCRAAGGQWSTADGMCE
ncbi:hypothetical protein [Bradyrhizobium sp. WSM3983]|uniref:hypothetical protein n=1 Tax=Bradyrhizobium sp. WSM3983 TaxID=1038867 RepID=UPI000422ABB8|nr:hypothetical protein [Bradyrhizobium sp. WSM3983]